jgi:hypothetical protein
MSAPVRPFDARAHLAAILRCEPVELALFRGPTESYRGIEADYIRGESVAGTVLIGRPTSRSLGRGTRRMVSTQTRTHLERTTIAVDAEVTW